MRHCHSGLDVAALRAQVLRSSRRLLPVAAFFTTADPETLLVTGAFAEEPLAAGDAAFREACLRAAVPFRDGLPIRASLKLLGMIGTAPGRRCSAGCALTRRDGRRPS